MSTRGSAIDAADAAVDGTCVTSAVIVCNSDIGTPLWTRGRRRARTLPSRSVLVSEDAVDADSDHGTADDGRGVHVGCLAAGIKGREEKQAGQAACDAACDDFRDDVSAAPGTAVPVCKVALAVRTCRH